ncbi:hypothetical protein PPYR_00710 [Photinus pyralis]|uniref:DDE Tnp4 domain-containing protein n=1 Tax=Photinus pyralis TaxID=7054 RepID=A0A5N4B2W4_PHOPY|nr:hypothetical protein PPYR_00710 [Photinus pyralis]
MKSKTYLLLIGAMCKQKTCVFQKQSYKLKIKKIYMAYLAAKLAKKRSKPFAVRKVWTRSIYTEEKRLLYGCGNSLFCELEKDSSRFINYFRMNDAMFSELLNMLQPTIKKQVVVRIPIEPKIRLAITLRYLASGDSMKSVSYAFRVAPQTVSEIIAETCEAIWNSLREKVLLENPTEEDWKNISKDFELKWNFPHCIGAIDGKHVIIQAPPNSGSSHYNYKNSHSIILMAMVDANMRFTLVDIGAPGRKSDSGVFRMSSIGMGLENNLLNVPKECPISRNLTFPFVVVGDEAFALTNYMMRPYPRNSNLNRRKKFFNYRLSRARRVVECAFGILRGRWRIFAKPIIASETTIIKIIQATICLHNFILKKETVLPITEHAYSELNCMSEQNTGFLELGRSGRNVYSRNVAHLRDRLAEYFEGEGAVPWQLEKVESNDF